MTTKTEINPLTILSDYIGAHAERQAQWEWNSELEPKLRNALYETGDTRDIRYKDIIIDIPELLRSLQERHQAYRTQQIIINLTRNLITKATAKEEDKNF